MATGDVRMKKRQSRSAGFLSLILPEDIDCWQKEVYKSLKAYKLRALHYAVSKHELVSSTCCAGAGSLAASACSAAANASADGCSPRASSTPSGRVLRCKRSAEFKVLPSGGLCYVPAAFLCNRAKQCLQMHAAVMPAHVRSRKMPSPGTQH